MDQERLSRRQFLFEMREGLWQTAKELLRPAAEEKLERLEEAARRLGGIRYAEIARLTELTDAGLIRKQAGAAGILLYQADGSIYAASEQCPFCRMLLQVNIFSKKILCFSCDKSMEWTTGEGDLSLTVYPVKAEAGAIYIGIKD